MRLQLLPLPLLLLLPLMSAMAEIGPYDDVIDNREIRPTTIKQQQQQREDYRFGDGGSSISVHTVHRNRDFSTGTANLDKQDLNGRLDEEVVVDGGNGGGNGGGGEEQYRVSSSDSYDGRTGVSSSGSRQPDSFVVNRDHLTRHQDGFFGTRDNSVGKRRDGHVGRIRSGEESYRGRGGRRNEVFARVRSPVGSTSAENTRERLDGLSVQLQRLGDRLLSMETAITRRGERIDSVQYRLTLLESSGEEQKAAISELSAAVRHRMQTADFEMDKIRDAIDGLNDGLVNIAAQNTKMQAFLEAQRSVAVINRQQQQEQHEGGAAGQRLKAVATAVHGVRASNLAINTKIDGIVRNMTAIAAIATDVGVLRENSVTKAYLRSCLAEMRRESQVQQQSPVLLIQGTAPLEAQQPEHPIDCHAVHQQSSSSGVYLLQPRRATRAFFAYCDMTTEGGGWTVLQRRQDGSVDFLREWIDYKYGFGNLAGEFWLGNDHIHLLTNQHVVELRIELSDFGQQTAVARYSAFATGHEEEGYALKMLGHYTGDAGDSLSYHVGQRWSTIDADSDAWMEQNCARDHKGAWWYRSCDTSNLNGQYLHGPVPQEYEYQGIYWYDFRGPLYSLWRTRIMIRRGGHVGAAVLQPATTTTSPPGDRSDDTMEQEEMESAGGAGSGDSGDSGDETMKRRNVRQMRQDEGLINTDSERSGRSTVSGGQPKVGRPLDPDRGPLVVYDHNYFYK